MTDPAASPTDPAATAGTESKKKEKGPSIEELWRMHLSETKTIGYTVDEAGIPILYQWKAWHWEALSDFQHKVLVDAFCTLHKVYSKSSAQSCMWLTESAIANTRLPLASPEVVMIATQGHVLEVEQNGRLVVSAVKPDGNYILGKGSARSYLIPSYIPVKLDPTRIHKGKDGKLVYIPRANLQTETGLWGKLILGAMPDPVLRSQFQEFFGDMLTPIQRKAFPVMVGEADCGKSQILSVGMRLAPAPGSGDLDDTGGFSLSGWLGKQAIFIDELPARVDNESMFKRLIGGAIISVRRHYKTPLTIVPRWKVMAGCNEIVAFSEKSDAMNTRLRIFPCQVIPEEDRVEFVGQKITAGYTDESGVEHENEMASVFDWALVGLQAIMARGRALSRHELTAESGAYAKKLQETSNPALLWIEEWEIRPSKDGTQLPKKELLKLFRKWADESGHGRLANVSAQAFFRDFFFRAMDKTYGAHWDGDREHPQKLAAVDGTRQYCVPVVLLNACARVDYARKAGGDFKTPLAIVKAEPALPAQPAEPEDEWGIPISQSAIYRGPTP